MGDWHEKTMGEIAEYLCKKGYHIRRSHKRKKGEAQLFTGQSSNATRMTKADIVLIENKLVKYIVEVQTGCRPKEIIGIIGATNLSTTCVIGKETYNLEKPILIVTYKSPQKKGSKKEQQLKLIQNTLRVRQGCLKEFLICSYQEFRNEFERLEKHA